MVTQHPRASRALAAWPLLRWVGSLMLMLLLPGIAQADLVATVPQIKPAVVAIGTYQRTRSPAFRLLGTGFAVGDGHLVATNAHVVPLSLDINGLEELVVIRPQAGGGEDVRKAVVAANDPVHDLNLLKIDGAALPTLKLRQDASYEEGQAVAFTGFPIIGALGVYHATHRGIISGLPPVVVPQANSAQLNPQAIKRAREGAFVVLQLDATAYPGNSGSPVFDPDNGEVLGIINMVWLKGAKESALSAPSGISYAVPVSHLIKLVSRVQP